MSFQDDRIMIIEELEDKFWIREYRMFSVFDILCNTLTIKKLCHLERMVFHLFEKV